MFKQLPISVPRTNKQASFGSTTDIPGSGTEDEDSDDDLSVIHTDFEPPIPTPLQSSKTPKTPTIESVAANHESHFLLVADEMPVTVEYDILRNQPNPLIPDSTRRILACCFTFSGGFD